MYYIICTPFPNKLNSKSLIPIGNGHSEYLTLFKNVKLKKKQRDRNRWYYLPTDLFVEIKPNLGDRFIMNITKNLTKLLRNLLTNLNR